MRSAARARLLVTAFVRYVFACGCRRDWTDGTATAPTRTVELPEVCNRCKRAADAKRAELRRLYGKEVNQIERRKRQGRP